jgi:hypothetical protein
MGERHLPHDLGSIPAGTASRSVENVSRHPHSVQLRHLLCALIGAALALLPAVSSSQASLNIPPAQLVREVVYNELQDHARHGNWRYSIEQQEPDETRLVEQIETADGPVTRLFRVNGSPLDLTRGQAEQARLDHLLSSPTEQAHARQQYAEDQIRIGRYMAMFPDAFLFDYAGEQDGCHHLRFRPNPNYTTHTIESRIFHSMSGDLWIDARLKRVARVEGRLQNNLDIGFGLLGRINKGGWFRMQRTQVGATEWKTQHLEIHLNGSAMLFKSIGRQTSQARRAFTPVPAGLNLAQGIDMLRSQNVAETRAVPVAPSHSNHR